MTGTMHLIIDSDGSTFSAYDETLVARWGYPDPDFDLRSFAVRNLGAIDVLVEAEQVTLTFRWLMVRPVALDSLIELLGRLPSRPVLVRTEAGTWIEQSLPTPEEAAEWVTANRALARGSVARNMITTPRHLRALSDRSLSKIDDVEDRLSLMFKKWRLSHGLFNADIASFLVRFGMFDRTVIVAKSHNDNSLLFEHVGSAFALYENSDSAWNFRAQGMPVVDQPDPDFGRWIDDTYRGVLDGQKPRFDYVDTVIQARGANPYRFCYDRLLLPWQSADGTMVLTGTSYNQHASLVTQ